MTKPVDQQLGSFLFSAPAEVRDCIYDHYLAFGHDDFADTPRPGYVFLEEATAAAPHTTPLPALMRACKRAYGDLAPRVHTTAALRVRLHGFGNARRVGVAVHGPLHWERLRRLALVVAMEHANWNAWLGFLDRLAPRLAALEHFLIDWAPRPVVAHATVWAAAQHQKKEDEFLDMLARLPTLRTVHLYGQAPSHWVARLSRDNTVTIKQSPHRWWKEPGFDNWE